VRARACARVCLRRERERDAIWAWAALDRSTTTPHHHRSPSLPPPCPARLRLQWRGVELGAGSAVAAGDATLGGAAERQARPGGLGTGFWLQWQLQLQLQDVATSATAPSTLRLARSHATPTRSPPPPPPPTPPLPPIPPPALHGVLRRIRAEQKQQLGGGLCIPGQVILRRGAAESAGVQCAVCSVQCAERGGLLAAGCWRTLSHSRTRTACHTAHASRTLVLLLTREQRTTTSNVQPFLRYVLTGPLLCPTPKRVLVS
jgi:hypothetical protein